MNFVPGRKIEIFHQYGFPHLLLGPFALVPPAHHRGAAVVFD